MHEDCECRSVGRASKETLYLYAYCVACVLQLALLPGIEWLAVTAVGRHASDLGGQIACRAWYFSYGIFFSFPTWLLLPPVIAIGMPIVRPLGITTGSSTSTHVLCTVYTVNNHLFKYSKPVI